ncbi:hypothetical protein M8818_007495 [Zalaria obscura]|uniref:Uncharacterized protein n=1 Tax=Zalaria obscura TaxID=2024903 RepID=A0ACC3S3C9_9PEZI
MPSHVIPLASHLDFTNHPHHSSFVRENFSAAVSGSEAMNSNTPHTHSSTKRLARKDAETARGSLPSPAPSEGSVPCAMNPFGASMAQDQSTPQQSTTRMSQRSEQHVGRVRVSNPSTLSALSPLQDGTAIETPAAQTPTFRDGPSRNGQYSIQGEGPASNQHIAPVAISQHHFGPSLNLPRSDATISQHHFKLSLYLPRLDEFEAAARQAGVLSDKDTSILGILREAIQAGDFHFILLIRLLADRKTGSDMLPPVRTPFTKNGLDLIETICSPATDGSNNVRMFLAQFPEPFPVLVSHITALVLQSELNAISSFLHQLPGRWHTLVDNLKRAKTLPLPQDLSDALRTQSRILQRLMFRRLQNEKTWNGGWDAHLVERVFQLFIIDQEHFFRHGRLSHDAAMNRRLEYQQLLLFSSVANAGAYQRHLPPAVSSQSAILATQQQAPARSPGAISQQPLSRMPAAISFSPSLPSAAGRSLSSASHNQRTATASPQSSILIPAAGYLSAQPARPNNISSALHQAHLRSPVLKARKSLDLSVSSQERYYSYVSDLQVPPRHLARDTPVQRFSFTVDPVQFAKLPDTVDLNMGAPGNRSIDEGTQLFRFRCCHLPQTSITPSDSAWAGLDCIWRDYIYFTINDFILEPRCKLHYGKYLPIDLTAHIRPGDNVLTAYINRASTDTSPLDLAVAVEVVGFLTRSKMREDCLGNRLVLANDVLGSIKASLSPSSGSENDDEVAIVDSNINIPLFEPFSNARMFDLPVRGRNCAHRQAFDLDTFLETRRCPESSIATDVDVWKCPICNADVRPQELIVDGFLMHVRRVLGIRNMLDCRAIIVEKDGTWRPKQEPNKGEGPYDDEEQAVAGSRDGSAVAGATRQAQEVVDLDSD